MRRLVVAFAVAVALAGCGESPEDGARDAGEEIGEAARGVAQADSPQDARAALQELADELEEVDLEIRDRIADQVAVQRETLEGALDDPAALRSALQQMQAQAAAFRDGEDSVANEFWRGVQDGYEPPARCS